MSTPSYPLLFANYQKNSYSPYGTQCKGLKKWSIRYENVIGPEVSLNPHALLYSNGHIVLKEDSFIYVFDSDGQFKFALELGRNSFSCPAVLNADQIAYFKGGSLLNYISFNGKKILDSEYLTGRVDWSYVPLLKPGQHEVIVCNQYTGGPNREPPCIEIYKQPLGEFDWHWEYIKQERCVNCLLTTDEKLIVVLTDQTVTLINTTDGSVFREIDTGLSVIENGSINLEGDIVLIGKKKGHGAKCNVIMSITIDGDLKWEHILGGPIVNQPPVCSANESTFVLDNSCLLCLIAGKKEWEIPLLGLTDPYLTISQNNTVILVNGYKLAMFTDGDEVFSTIIGDLKSTIQVPAILTENGSVLVTSDDELFCFE